MTNSIGLETEDKREDDKAVDKVNTWEPNYKEIVKFLSKPFDPNDILWRVGKKSKDKQSGLVFAYMNARAVQERLDALVCNHVGGAIDWSNEYSVLDLGTMEVSDYSGKHTVPLKGFKCRITIYLDNAGYAISREDGANVTDFEPIKGGMSDAFKRAASALGMGRYLYKLPQTWTPIGTRGEILKNPKLPFWALPDGYLDEHPDYGTSDVADSDVEQATDNAAKSLREHRGVDGKHPVRGKKHSGEMLEDLNDVGFLKWVAANYSDEGSVAAAQKRIAELSAGDVQ